MTHVLNIVIPMAGRGSRFREVGYALPKPLIPVLGKPMIQVVINNLRPARPHRFIFICLQEHLTQYNVERDLKKWSPGCEVVTVDRVTEGAACTVLLAREFINNSDGLMIANSDQWVDVDINAYLVADAASDADGFIMTMWADHPKWSYIRFDSTNGIPTEVVEKEVVSNEATVGIYNYKHGADFVAAAEEMIAQNIRVKNEFYVAPAYNMLLAQGKTIGYYNIGQEYAGAYGLGTPEDLDKFKTFEVARRAVAFD